MYKKFIFLLGCILATPSLYSQTAKVQVVHNSPDISLEVVDVYLGDQLWVDSLLFRWASPYQEVAAGGPLVISILAEGATDTSLALHKDTFNLMADSSYIMVLSGFIDNSLYDSIRPLKLATANTRLQARQSGHTAMLVYNGAPEEPPIRINETSLPLVGLVDSLPYFHFAGYTELPTADYDFEVINTWVEDTVAKYQAPFNTWNLQDSSVVIMASGFVDSLKSNPGDSTSELVPMFGLYAALPSGGPLMRLPVLSGIGIDELQNLSFSMYPNPSNGELHLRIPPGLKLEAVELLALDGKLLQRYYPQKDEQAYRLNLSSQAPGVYLVAITTRTGEKLVQKLILQ